MKQTKPQAQSASDHPKPSNWHPKEGSSTHDVKQATIKKETPGIDGFAMATSLLAAKAIYKPNQSKPASIPSRRQSERGPTVHYCDYVTYKMLEKNSHGGNPF